MDALERLRLVDEVRLAGNCVHPIRLRGEMVELETGEVNHRDLRVACRDRREVVCPSCSSLYQADAWILVSAGMIGGKGISSEAAEHPKLFVTLTAPSFGAVHTRRSNGSCHPPRSVISRCAHGRPHSCPLRHETGDELLGTPLCSSCFDYRGAVLWNAHASRLFAETMRQLSRRVASVGGVSRDDFVSQARINYLKVAEVQRRGLIHFHAILRLDGPEHAESPPPSWLTATLVEEQLRVLIPTVRSNGVDHESRRWGSQFDTMVIDPIDPDLGRVASYLAKYSVKTTDASLDFAYRFKNRSEIVGSKADPHRQRIALTAWDLASERDLGRLNLRLHAHAFGFTGQLITKSRGFTTSFTALRGARASYMSRSNTHLALPGTFHYSGRGYDHPKAAQLAGVFHEMQRELRQQRALAKKAASRDAHA